MRSTIFLRLTKDGQVNATQTSKVEPLRDTRGKAKSTVFLALQVNIPDEAFRVCIPAGSIRPMSVSKNVRLVLIANAVSLQTGSLPAWMPGGDHHEY